MIALFATDAAVFAHFTRVGSERPGGGGVGRTASCVHVPTGGAVMQLDKQSIARNIPTFIVSDPPTAVQQLVLHRRVDYQSMLAILRFADANLC